MKIKKLISNGNPSLTMAIRNDTDIRYLPIIGWHFNLGLATPVTIEDVDDNSIFAVFDSVTNDWWVDNGGVSGNGEEPLVNTFDLYKQLSMKAEAVTVN